MNIKFLIRSEGPRGTPVEFRLLKIASSAESVGEFWLGEASEIVK
jgi:hypothetical protein